MTLDMPSIPLTVLVLVGVGSPALLLVLLGGASLVNRPLPERWTGPLAGSSMAIACAALVMALLVYGVTGTGTQLLSYGAWSTSREGGIEGLSSHEAIEGAAFSSVWLNHDWSNWLCASSPAATAFGRALRKLSILSPDRMAPRACAMLPE